MLRVIPLHRAYAPGQHAHAAAHAMYKHRVCEVETAMQVHKWQWYTHEQPLHIWMLSDTLL